MSSRCFQGMRIDSFLISANLHTVCYGSIPGWCLSTTAIVNLVPVTQYSPQCRKWLQMQQALIPRQQPRRRAQTVPSQRFGRSLTMHHAVQSHLVLRLHRCKSRCATNSTCVLWSRRLIVHCAHLYGGQPTSSASRGLQKLVIRC